MDLNSDLLQPTCNFCTSQLYEPYIECAECDDVYLCCLCFSRGVEIKQHKSNHNYAVRKNNFPLFENCNWVAKDEYCLLKYICEHGYGNWEEVSKSVQTHSKLECQEHYRKYYIDNIQNEELPHFYIRDGCSAEESGLYPFLLRESNNDEPPRPTRPGAAQYLAGYNPCRADFEMNFDNNAESVLCLETGNEPESDDLLNSLQCASVMAYNNKLKERKRRYSIIRQHGLIIVRKFFKWIQQFEDTLGQPACERLPVFMQLLPAIQFDAFMERLSIEKELIIYLHKLYDYRKNGLTTFKGCHLYRHLKRKEDKHSKDFKNYLSSSELDWKSLSSDIAKPIYGTNKDVHLLFNPLSKDINTKAIRPKRGSMPLEIIGLPGYEQLSEKERTLCSSLRLLPTNFVAFRDILISENNKNGCLRLLDARKLIKIDVNKTRKLYDYLMNEGFISKGN